jgi:hypothetical protein
MKIRFPIFMKGLYTLLTAGVASLAMGCTSLKDAILPPFPSPEVAISDSRHVQRVQDLVDYVDGEQTYYERWDSAALEQYVDGKNKTSLFVYSGEDGLTLANRCLVLRYGEYLNDEVFADCAPYDKANRALTLTNIGRIAVDDTQSAEYRNCPEGVKAVADWDTPDTNLDGRLDVSYKIEEGTLPGPFGLRVKAELILRNACVGSGGSRLGEIIPVDKARQNEYEQRVKEVHKALGL